MDKQTNDTQINICWYMCVSSKMCYTSTSSKHVRKKSILAMNTHCVKHRLIIVKFNKVQHIMPNNWLSASTDRKNRKMHMISKIFFQMRSVTWNNIFMIKYQMFINTKTSYLETRTTLCWITNQQSSVLSYYVCAYNRCILHFVKNDKCQKLNAGL